MSPRLRPVGRRALLAEVADAAAALDLAAHLRAAVPQAADVVPGACTVLVDGLADPADAEAVRTAVRSWRPGGSVPEGPVVEVPVVYDGADLDAVAARWGTDRDGAVQRHAAGEYVAAFCGFAPGFAYLAGLPAELAVPRHATPRPRVPAGSVALADTWCGVYPTASPGGWQLLGRTDLALWDPDRWDPDAARGRGPALLAPGTRVRFVPR